MQRALSPRQLSPDEAERIVTVLRGHALELTFTMLGDAEAGNYARQIGATLQAAGVRLNIISVGMIAWPTYGLILSGEGADLQLLSDALSGAGIMFTTQPGSALTMTVALKQHYVPRKSTSFFFYSTVTLFAKFRGWSTSVPRSTATW